MYIILMTEEGINDFMLEIDGWEDNHRKVCDQRTDIERYILGAEVGIRAKVASRKRPEEAQESSVNSNGAGSNHRSAVDWEEDQKDFICENIIAPRDIEQKLLKLEEDV